jgi:hypothetical protein
MTESRRLVPMSLIALAFACGGGARDTGEDRAAPADTLRGEQAPPAEAQAAPDASDDTTATGVVRVVGADPITTVVLDSAGSHVALRGSLEVEVARLVGATVRVRGRPVPNAPPTPPRAVEVSDYDVLSINGATPVVGILRLGDDAPRIEGDSTVLLAFTPPGLLSLAGAKVWVVGRREGGWLVVQGYGVIRDPGR